MSDAVIAAIPGIFVFQDASGRNLRWNKNIENIIRFPLGDVQRLGNVAEEHRALTDQAIQQVFRMGAATVEAEILVKDGRTIPYYISGVRVELDGKQHLAAVGVDISDRKQAEQTIRRSEEELRSLVEHSPYGIARTSVREDRFLSVNPALVKMLGYKSEAEVLALKLSRDLYFEAESRGFRAQLTRADYFSGVDFAWKRKDGKPINVRASGRRIPSSKSQEEILEVMIEDVTARRVLEEQLRQAQKMEALGQLAGSVAHDFNNLLAVIIGYCELLARATGPDGSSRGRIETIKRAGERAASLTAQLLAFSRRQVMQPRIVNLNSLVLETDKMLQRLMGEDVEHQVILDPNLGRTRADPGQIVQVIMNLAVNARDAMPRGGKLTIQTSFLTFDEGEEIQGIPVAAGHYLVLTVSDTGTGMDAKTHSRLFEPFFTTKPMGKGTGLGLATVYGVVKQSGGFIFAETELGKGTSFKVLLPQVEGVPEAVSAKAPPAEVLQSSETVLLVEDEPAFRDLLRETLQTAGFRVLAGTDGVDALQIAEQHRGPIQLLVTDVIMPRMSGPELAKCLKEVRPEIRVLYLSGYTDDKLDSVSKLDRELALMQKPFDLRELIEKIREILARTDSPAVPLRGSTNFKTSVNRPSKGDFESL
jgi:PAS domain S-box-containing protein